MNLLISSPKQRLTLKPVPDRPGWVPAGIKKWDSDPYAYQTEEELMPAGGLHGQLLGYIMELLRHVLLKRDLMLLLDTFLLYRDANGVKQRIAPDLMVIRRRSRPPKAYDLDHAPPPLAVLEVTSPKSQIVDKGEKMVFYLGLGIPTYVVVDAVTAESQLKQQIELYGWELVNGRSQAITPDSNGQLLLSMLGLQVMVQEGRLRFIDRWRGEVLRDMGELLEELDAKTAELTTLQNTLEQEKEIRQAAEAELAQLKAKLQP